MYRIRFHGRGGQGMKTASRILGTALFLSGFEVQDAPRYGAERRGAPIFAYVRADRAPINERGIISNPDLIIAADHSLLGMPGAGVLAGAGPETVLLVATDEAAALWQERLNLAGPLLTLSPLVESQKHTLGAACAAAAARLLGRVELPALVEAVRQELAPLGRTAVEASLAVASRAYEAMGAQHGMVREGGVVPAENYPKPNWIELGFEDATISAPAIHAAATTEKLQTGLWRTERPVIDQGRCNRCWWICSTFCPEGAIAVDEERRPRIDYEHCKGCMVCLVQCPTHAIEARPETAETAKEGAQ